MLDGLMILCTRVLLRVFSVRRCFTGTVNLDWESSGADDRQEKTKETETEKSRLKAMVMIDRSDQLSEIDEG